MDFILLLCLFLITAALPAAAIADEYVELTWYIRFYHTPWHLPIEMPLLYRRPQHCADEDYFQMRIFLFLR